jgi:hypothetical protein
MKKIISVLLTAMLFIASSAYAADVFVDLNNTFCAELTNFQAEINKTAPRKVDEMTEIINVQVNCQNKVVRYSKRILATEHELAKGWKERKQIQHHQLHCNTAGLASKAKWTAMDVIADKNYQYLITITTTPKDCK